MRTYELKTGHEMLRVMTYNIHHGAGNDETEEPASREDGGPAAEVAVDLQRIADVMLAEYPTIVALQEVDRFWARSGGVDQPEELARLMAMNVCYGANLVHGSDEGGGIDHEYGVATFTTWPILHCQNYPLPTSNEWEPRGMLDTRIEVTGVGEVAILNTHLQSNANGDHQEACRQRRQQAEMIARHIESIDVPVILMGDFNAAVESGDVDVLADGRAGLQEAWGLAGAGQGSTVPAHPDRDPVVRIDLIFASAEFRVASAAVVDNHTSRMASDHFPVIVDLQPL